MMNRAMSIRSSKNSKGSPTEPKPASKHRFTLASLRGNVAPQLSKRLFKLIKSENYVITAYENAGRERIAIASQLSEWGESTGDDGVSDISDKLGVILSELGEKEDGFAQNLEEYRASLKQIRNTEASVQPSRDHKAKIADEIAKLKYKEPESTKLPILEQELVRAEAENLVAEAQLTNITRQKVKEAYDLHFAAVIERAEKQAILARHGRSLLNYLDDTPVVPGDARPAYEHEAKAHQVLADAEQELHSWKPTHTPIEMQSAGMESNLMPPASVTEGSTVAATQDGEHIDDRGMDEVSHTGTAGQGQHLAESTEKQPPYPVEQEESVAA